MGYLKQFRNDKHINYLTVQNLIELGGSMKGIYDGAKKAFALGTVAGEAAAPYLIPLLGL